MPRPRATPLARQIVRHEADALRTLAGLPATAGHVPGLLFSGEVDGAYVTAQTPLKGRPAGQKFTPAHARLLESLRTGEIKRAADTELVRELRPRLDALPVNRPELRDALDALLPLLEEMTVPVTVIHGDFAPWNLREHKGTISAFDWEYAVPGGLPLFDETHYRLQVGYQLNAWTPERAYAALAEWAASRPMGLRPEHAATLQAVYLVDNLVRLFDEGYDDADDMVGWYGRLLARFDLKHHAREVAYA